MLDTDYFVNTPALQSYNEYERINDHDDSTDLQQMMRLHKRGSFVYRLAKRDQEKSALYYTQKRCVTAAASC